jgi:PilZ domain
MFFPKENQSVTAMTKNLSLSGIGVEVALPFQARLGEEVRLESTDSYGGRHDIPALIKNKKEYNGKTFLGIEFVSNEITYPLIVSFVYGDSQRWLDITEERSKRVPSLRVTFNDLRYFMQRGIKGSFEQFVFLNKFTVPAVRKLWSMLLVGIKTYQPRLKRRAS